MVSAGVVLPPDVLWEILLRLPARLLCRFRAVCRLWRSVLSDPSFAKTHAAVHPDLILALAGVNDRIDMTDCSGNVVRRISIAPEDVGVPHNPHPGPFYLLRDHNRVRVLDPDTGAASTLPFDDLQRGVGSSLVGSYALGRVPSTGQHKVLRVVARGNYHRTWRIEQHCHVLTLGDDDGRRSWRPMAGAPLRVEFDTINCHMVAHSAVIQGVVYFLPDRTFPRFQIFGPATDVFHTDINCVMAFDLETEEWRPATLPGLPAIRHSWDRKLAKLNGGLAMLCHPRFHDHPTIEIDLWFARDLEKGVWVKEHSIRLEFPNSQPWMVAPDFQLLTVLDDGRVIFYYSAGNSSSAWRTWIYDPRTKSWADVPQHGVSYIAGMYRESMCLESSSISRKTS